MTYEEILQTQPETPLFITIPLILIPVSTFIIFMCYFIKRKKEVSSDPVLNKIMYVFISIIISLVIATFISFFGSIWDDVKTIAWENDSLEPFLEENVEIQESEDIKIKDYDYSNNEAEYTFVLENGKTAHGTSGIKFDLKNGEKPFAKYRYNDEYIEHVPLEERNELKMDEQKSSFYSFHDNNALKDLTDVAYFGVYDVELHVPKDYIGKLPS